MQAVTPDFSNQVPVSTNYVNLSQEKNMSLALMVLVTGVASEAPMSKPTCWMEGEKLFKRSKKQSHWGPRLHMPTQQASILRKYLTGHHTATTVTTAHKPLFFFPNETDSHQLQQLFYAMSLIPPAQQHSHLAPQPTVFNITHPAPAPIPITNALPYPTSCW